MRWIRTAIVSGFALAAAAAALAGSLAGSAARDAEAVRPAAPPELTATAEIRRLFTAPGHVAIAVTNHGDADVRLLEVELDTESFAPLGVQAVDVTVPPSVNPRDLLVPYGEARCPDGLASTAAPAAVILTVATEDGVEHPVTLELPYPDGTLDRLVREGCAAQAVAAAARIDLGALTETEDGALAGRLLVTPLREASLAVTEVRGSVLFTIEAGEPVREAGGASVPLRFDAPRCDGHTVGDVKQPFAFTVWIAIDGAEPVAAPIAVGGGQQDALWAMLDRRCGL